MSACNVADTRLLRFFDHPALQAIMKFSNHPSINAIKCCFKQNANFYFSEIDTKTVLKKFKNLEKKKAVQDTGISVKIVKGNAEFFTEKSFLQLKKDDFRIL